MKLVFVSNLITPHQIPLANELYGLLQDQYAFIETIPRNKDLPKGWSADGDECPYVISYESVEADRKNIIKMICEAECVVFGAAPYSYVQDRLKAKKLTFLYSERIYKKKPPCYREILPRALKYYFKYGRYNNLYLLCASAFVYADYAKTRTFLEKAYKWGYFPAFYHYDLESLMEKKKHKTVQLLWVGRMIDWKHPETAISVAEYLEKKNISYRLKMVGKGDLKEQIEKLIVEKGLARHVSVEGEVSPAQARSYMEDSNILLLTSDRNEGWGATLNEAMNSGCAVVANHEIGAVPYLIDNGKNGLIYENGNIDDVCEKVDCLIGDFEYMQSIGKNAYTLIEKHWNPNIAAHRLLRLVQILNKRMTTSDMFDDGICSKSEILRDDWYRSEHNEKDKN